MSDTCTYCERPLAERSKVPLHVAERAHCWRPGGNDCANVTAVNTARKARDRAAEDATAAAIAEWLREFAAAQALPGMTAHELQLAEHRTAALRTAAGSIDAGEWRKKGGDRG